MTIARVTVVLSVLLIAAGCASAPKADSEAAVQALRNAQIAAASGQPKKAHDLLDEAVRLNPDSPEALFARGVSYGERGNYHQAIRDLSAAIRLAPSMALAYHFRALGYESIGDFERALRDLNRALALEADNAAFLNHRGYIFGILGEMSAALRDLDHAILRNPASASSRYNRALVLFHRGSLREAIEDLSVALKLRADFPDARFLSGVVRELLGQRELALSDFEKSLTQLDRIVDVQTHRMLILLSGSREEIVEAKLLGNANWARTWPEIRMRFLAGKADEKELVAAATSERKNRPENLCVVYYLVGRFHELKGGVPSAVAAYKKCLETRQFNRVEIAAASMRLRLLTAK